MNRSADLKARTDNTQTDLYLVRIWRRKSKDGAPGVRGKLQHVLSGESSYFEALSDLPAVLQKMLEQQVGPLGSDARDR
jgi:hypothetical protein